MSTATARCTARPLGGAESRDERPRGWPGGGGAAATAQERDGLPQQPVRWSADGLPLPRSGLQDPKVQGSTQGRQHAAWRALVCDGQPSGWVGRGECSVFNLHSLSSLRRSFSTLATSNSSRSRVISSLRSSYDMLDYYQCQVYCIFGGLRRRTINPLSNRLCRTRDPLC